MIKKNKINKKKQLAKNQTNEIKSQLKNIDAYVDFEKNIFIYSKELKVSEFAKKINKKENEIIKYFFIKGIILKPNDILKEEQLGELCLEFGYDFKKEKKITHENILENFKIKDNPETFIKRAPIATIMGHVDHGKTTLLDVIRNSNIVSKEYGGITQHIGAYQIKIKKSNNKITFIDTPGHEAFTEMRIRGSLITDIVILVIAADDGIKPQTQEAISHAKIAKVPIIIFINKIDKNNNIENIFSKLSESGLIPEEWGGNIPCIKGSAKNKIGINELLETILLIAEINNLKANPNRFAIGTVIESHLNKNVGPIATLLVQSGTLKTKDALVAGNVFGYVRYMENENGEKINSAGPSVPVKIHGLNNLPNAGDKFMVFKDEKYAREISIKRKNIEILNKNNNNEIFSFENFTKKIENEKLKQINILLKADAHGTAEAIKNNINKINLDGIKINIIHTGIGDINNSDILLSIASKCLIIGFNIKIPNQIKKKADDEKINIKIHTVIYKIIEEILSIANKMIEPEIKKELIGIAEVKKIFYHSKIGTIAGSYVNFGLLKIKSQIKIIRNGKIICESEINSLKKEKENLKEVKEGNECGIIIKNFNDIKEKDIIEAYIEKKIK